MFCTPEELCESHKPKEPKKAASKKSAASRKESAAPKPGPASKSTTETSGPPITPAPAATVDLKAAMKAAIKPDALIPSVVPKSPAILTPPKSSAPSTLPVDAMRNAARTESESVSTENEELAVAINNLEPILHPDEKAKHADILNRPDMRAARWKARRSGSTT